MTNHISKINFYKFKEFIKIDFSNLYKQLHLYLIVMNIISNKEIDYGECVFILLDNFLSPIEIEYYHQKINEIEDWRKGTFLGGEIQRLQKWYQDDNKYFSKHWITQTHDRWHSNESEEWLLKLRSKVQNKIDEIFKTHNFEGSNHSKINSSLINFYRSGNDYIKYHADDELIFGSNPTISMLTFGCERSLKFKRNNKDESYLDKSFTVKSGSLFIMMGAVQKYYKHGIEKENDISDVRYSLTFREHK
jgi:alkylated DNA repair dioxygenase AlkB